MSEDMALEDWVIEDAELPGALPPTGSPRVTPDHKASDTPRSSGWRGRLRGPRARTGADEERSRARRAGRGAAPVRPAKRRKAVPNRKGQFVKPLTSFYTMLGIATTSRDQVCGPAIVEQAEACARAIDDLAYQNEAVRQVIWTLTQTGMMTKVAAAHAPILFAVGMHHSTRFRAAIDNTQMGEFIAGMLVTQAEAVRESLAKEAEGVTPDDFTAE